MRRRAATAGTSTVITDRVLSVSAAWKGVRFSPLFRLVSGYASARPAPIRSTSSWARDTATPGASRPTRTKLWNWRPPAHGPFRWRGNHRSTSFQKRKPAGITPTTVKGCPPRFTEVPNTEGSDPKRRSQSPWERRTTAGPSGSPSSGAKPRPSAGATPRAGKSPVDAIITRTRSGSPEPVRVWRRRKGVNAPSSAKEVDCSRKSKKSGPDTVWPTSPFHVTRPNTSSPASG